MAITYPITFPNVGIRNVTIRSKSVVGSSASPFTGQQQVYKHQGQWWEMDVSLPPMKRQDAEAVAAFLISLNGKYGTFLLGDPLASSPMGVGGSPVVSGAGQTGSSLIASGFTPSSTVMKAGDWFQLGATSITRLYKVMEDAVSDESGNATLKIWPDLRGSPGDGSALIINNPKGQWRLASNSTEYSVNEASVYGITFACVEAL